MPTRYKLEKELIFLHKELVKMGVMIEQSLEDTIYALKKQDVKLAHKVINNDDKIDEIEMILEEECLKILASQNPMAKDLREITSVLKMITDLERIADHCSDISEYTIKLSNMVYVKPLIHIPKMAMIVKEMVKLTVDSYIERDKEKALAVCNKDDKVDEYFENIVNELKEMMASIPSVVEQCIYFIFIVKYLERMADHATNVAEWVLYIITGEHRAHK